MVEDRGRAEEKGIKKKVVVGHSNFNAESSIVFIQNSYLLFTEFFAYTTCVVQKLNSIENVVYVCRKSDSKGYIGRIGIIWYVVQN